MDVLADPSEKHNIATQLPDVVEKMKTKLATFQYYVPELTPENLACYTCGETHLDPPHLWWQNFSGPCCISDTANAAGNGK